MYKIYKITKPGDFKNLYIGCTTYKYLSSRLGQHRNMQKKRPTIQLYTWLDKTCIIELIEISNDKNREYEIIKTYLNDSTFYLLNERVGIDTRENRENNRKRKYKSKKGQK